MIPKLGFLKNPTATAPNIKSGLEELVNETSLSASIFVSCPSCLSLAVNLAPAGNPVAIPIAHVNPPTPGTPNNGLINGSRSTPMNLTTPNPINNSEITKKGKRDGNTISHHICKPDMDASTDSLGRDIIEIAMKDTPNAS